MNEDEFHRKFLEAIRTRKRCQDLTEAIGSCLMAGRSIEIHIGLNCFEIDYHETINRLRTFFLNEQFELGQQINETRDWAEELR